MKQKSKLHKNCRLIGLICSFFFFGIIILVFLGCAGSGDDGTPDINTPLGIDIWTDGHDINPDEIDRHFIRVDDGLGYGLTPPRGNTTNTFKLFILPAEIRTEEDGTEICFIREKAERKNDEGIFITEADLAEIDMQTKGFTEHNRIDGRRAGEWAGLYYEPNSLYIHLCNGKWSYEQSAGAHETIHYIKNWHQRPDWAGHDGDGWDLQ